MDRLTIVSRRLLLLGFSICLVAVIVRGLLSFSDMNFGKVSKFLYYVVSTLGIYHSSTPVVKTGKGSVKGIVSVSREGRSYNDFRGIPYAKAPKDELRFLPPEPVRPWDFTFQADKFPNACLQFDAMMRGEIWGDEDCLQLNVFTPNLEPKKLMPVIAFIHGGGFTGGESSLYSPKFFMDHDIVFVTFNYRLASLGFLNTGDDLIRGNMGLKDQNLALKWVQENIKFFGGDPEKVTLMGESAGAASAHYHMVSPLSKGLFSRVILQSGSLGSPWAFARNPRNQALKFGKAVGCPTANTSILVDCLRKMDPREIVKPHKIIMSPIHTQDDFFPGSVEAVIDEGTFLGENPLLLLERGDFSRVPIMLGVNDGEGGLKTARLEAYPEILETLGEKWESYIPILMHFDPSFTNVSALMKEKYFPGVGNDPETFKFTGKNSQELKQNLTQLLSSGIFSEGVSRMGRLHSQFSPTYLHYYSYVSESVPSAYHLIKAVREKTFPGSWLFHMMLGAMGDFATTVFPKMKGRDPRRLYGACHGDDIMQDFSMSAVLDVKMISKDYKFSKEFVKTLVMFASGREPLTFNSKTWQPVNSSASSSLQYMELNETGGMIAEPFKEDVEFLQSLNIRDPLEPNNW